MAKRFDHLGLTRWPFPVVPEREYCTFLGDRKQLRSDVGDLLASLARRDTSSIHLFWAWFGAGKTHTLFYLANTASGMAKNSDGNAFHVIYSEFPKSARSFVDLYRSFLTGLDMDTLIDAFLEVSTCADSNRLRRELGLASLDLSNALQVMTSGQNQDQVTALRWLRAEPLPISEFRKIGISQRIGSVEEATRILSALIRLLMAAAQAQRRPGGRVLWLLDEFQRIERTGPRTLDEINTGLHSTFNACPNGLSLFLSFSGKPQSNLPGWFSHELRDRIGRTKVMILPPMLSDEALIFVKDVLAQFRPPEFAHASPYFPFNEDSCKAIIDEIGQKGDIKPRAIMQAFSAALEEADRRLETGEMSIIDSEFAKQVLEERIVLTVDTEDQQGGSSK
jgi:hypothetical protein